MIAGIEQLCEACASAARVAGSVERLLIRRVSRRAGFVDAEPRLEMDLLPSAEAIASMSDDAAWAALCLMRWPATGGQPSCPRCGAGKVYKYRPPRNVFVCASCKHQFTALSGTMFASHKKTYRELLALIAYDGPTHRAGVEVRTAIDTRRRKIANDTR